jgi:hypothetical protein
MIVKNKINYSQLVKSSRDLVKNKNFRNNQNYIISDFSKFKFSSKYYRSWFSKKAWKILRYLFLLMFSSWIILSVTKESFSSSFLINIYFYMCLIFFIFFLFILLFILFDRWIYYYYKKFSFIKRKHIFATDRYIFFKNPKKKAYRLNRRDFISFKK